MGSRPPSPDLNVNPPPLTSTRVYGTIRTDVTTAFSKLFSGTLQRSATRGEDIIPPIQARARPQDSMAQYTKVFDQKRTIAEAAKKLAEWSAAVEQRAMGGEQQQEDQEDEMREADRAAHEREEILGARHTMSQEEQERPQTMQENQQPGYAGSSTVPTSFEVNPAVNSITEEQFNAAREKIKYDRRRFHFAIVGKAGSGKSSLINAFLNQRSGEPGAAKTGMTGTTTEIARFQNPETKPPWSWTVWFDVPGVETLRISHLEYFKNQGLYAFNAIILVIGDRFDECDCSIVSLCERREIPCIIVRSKADQHIDNMLKEREEEQGDPHTWQESKVKARDECRATFREETRVMVEEGLHRADLESQKVFCVSRFTLKSAHNGTPTHGNVPKDRLDEEELVDTLESFAMTRRHLHKDPVNNTQPPPSQIQVSL